MNPRVIGAIVLGTIHVKASQLLFGCILWILSAQSYATGLMSVPTLLGAGAQTTVVYDPASYRYTYSYVISNGSDSTGLIWKIDVDVRHRPGPQGRLSSAGLNVQFGTVTKTFDEHLHMLGELLLPPEYSIVPIGLQAPPGWHAAFGRNGYASFAARTGTPPIQPGEQLDGLTLISYGRPTIREMQIIPIWSLAVPGGADKELRREAAETRKRINVVTYVLGPSDIRQPGSDLHWKQLISDVRQALTLGWIAETALAEQIEALLIHAQDALFADDGTLAKQRLQPVLELLAGAEPSNVNTQAQLLIKLNVDSLIANTPDTPIPFEPHYTLEPITHKDILGKVHQLVARGVNVANQNAPIVDKNLGFYIGSGPHEGTHFYTTTDSNGEANFSYQGLRPGTDKIVLFDGEQQAARTQPRRKLESGGLSGKQLRLTATTPQRKNYDTGDQLAEARMTWEGGPDLGVPLFIPPYLRSKSGNVVHIRDITANVGNVQVPLSVTRYYLAEKPGFDPTTGKVIGERIVGVLDPDGTDRGETQQYVIPGELPEGEYYLLACADADNLIVELDESNNCSGGELGTFDFVVVPVARRTNESPICSAAVADPRSLWPPNHKLVEIAINGVTDPDSESMAIEITSIFQDEPTNGLGDGDASPDGFGLGTPVASLRKERSGHGNGRVYTVGFKATDEQGASCESSVSVGVPHDQGGSSRAIDDGPRFDSTKL